MTKPRMRTVLITVIMIMVLTSGAHATEPDDYGMSIGFLINEVVGDFGLGAQVTSPFVVDAIALRATGSVQFSSDADWEPWGMLQVGMVGASRMVSDFARFYGEGGVVLAFPGTSLSTDPIGWGGYGQFGFEFFTGTQSPLSYFIEVGSTGSGLRADKLAAAPFMLNGLRINAGFRGYPQRKDK